MSETLILETKNEMRYAPSANVASHSPLDEKFTQQLASIPDKMAFKIGEVADLVGVKPYVLRYWETEFKVLKPQKSRHNQRVYSRKDVENVMMIKKLLHTDRFSIEGARSALKRLRKEAKSVSTISSAVSDYESLRDDVHELISDLQGLKKIFQL